MSIKRFPLFLVLALLLAACSAKTPSQISPSEVTIEVDDFKFTPETLVFQVGQTVTIHLVNVGEKNHEFMVGRHVAYTPEGLPNGFETDFFEGLTMEMSAANGAMFMGAGISMDMGMDMGGMDMGGDQGMAMDSGSQGMGADEHGMDMSGNQDMGAVGEHGTDMGGNQGMDMSGGQGGMSASGDEHGMSAGGDEHGMDGGGDDHHGFMIMLPQTAGVPEATITFTVTEDMVGVWEIGCFQDNGAHYDDGMRGTMVIVSP